MEIEHLLHFFPLSFISLLGGEFSSEELDADGEAGLITGMCLLDLP